MAKKLVVLGISLLFEACSRPAIDTRTEESMKSSVAQVRKSLPDDKRTEFDQAMQIIAFSQMSLGSLVKDGATGTDGTLDKVKASLNGKTGEQIIAEAAKITADRKAKEREQAITEIKELQNKKAAAQAAKVELAKFEVSRSRLYMQHREFLGEQPIIELTVRNGTGYAVSRAYFVGTLASPGRSVPWIKDSFNYQISGGLEPGEEAKWSLAPNMFSDWGKVKAPTDAVFTVEIEQLDGANGTTLYSASDFTNHDAERLTKLLAEFGAATK